MTCQIIEAVSAKAWNEELMSWEYNTFSIIQPDPVALQQMLFFFIAFYTNGVVLCVK